ncbi:MAG: glycosyltransferase family 39 protein [Nanoarchaeota archaeon]|nr:glycosyltransferase family 39 protein [Nanoarchaeota archaeon]
MRKGWYIIVGVLLLALALRLYQLDGQSLWFDEGYAVYEAKQEGLGGVMGATLEKSEGTPPLYFFMLHYWIKLFDDGLFAMRLLSAIFSALAVGVLFLFAREVAGRKVAFLSSLMMALSMTHLVYAQEIRPYALLSLMVLLSSYFYVRLLKTRKGAGYISATTLMLYTHYLGFFVFLVQVLYALWRKKLRPLPYQLSAGLLSIPSLVIFIKQLSFNQAEFQSALTVKLGLPAYLGQLGLVLFVMPFAGLVVLGWYLWKKRITKIKDSWFFVGCILIMAAYLLLLPRLMSSVFLTRYSHFLFPFAYVVFAYLFLRMKKPMLKKALAVVYIALVVVTLASYYLADDRKEQWTEAVGLVEGELQDNDIVVLIDSDSRFIWEYYQQKEYTVLPIRGKLGEDHSRHIQLLKQHEGRIWFVFSHGYVAQPLYEEELGRVRQKEFSKEFNGIEIVRYS